jgi:hypothetical protein
MSADKADARDYALTAINLKARRVTRRWKQAAEDYISMKHDEIVARGGVFDHEQIAADAVAHGEAMLAGELGAGDVADAA